MFDTMGRKIQAGDIVVKSYSQLDRYDVISTHGDHVVLENTKTKECKPVWYTKDTVCIVSRL